MRFRLYVLGYIFFWLAGNMLISCSGVDEKEKKENTVIIDSTAFFDSLYTPARYSLDTFFTARMLAKEFNGNVLFAERGRIVLKGCYGFRTPENKDSLQLSDRFQLASVSKTVTSAAVLQLYEQGKLSLEDTVGKFIDSFPYPGITVHMLLCHRSGLSNYNYFADDFSSKTIPFTNDSVIAIMHRHKPKVYYRPDEIFDYSNTGYVILAVIVEKVSGMKFSDYVQKNIFDVAGMKNSFICSNADTTDKRDKLNGYNGKDNLIEPHYQDGVVGDKGMYSTVEDLFLFDQALYNQKLLKDSVLKLAFSYWSSDRAEDGRDNYGYGWRLKQSFSGYEIVYHTGWWKGFRSYFIRNLTQKRTIILLDNIKRNKFLSVEELLDLFDRVTGKESFRDSTETPVGGEELTEGTPAR